jgi:drug/metabolite transporter (DMT)-like permease
MSANARAALIMALSMAAFTVNDAAMKSVTAEMPLFQAIALRGAVAVTCLLLIGRAQGSLRLSIPAGDARLVGLRCLAELGATAFFLLALVNMPIANLSAIMQALPLLVTLAAALVFGERIGWRRLLAIAVGLAGVLIIIRPGGEAFDRWSLMGLASVACVVVRDLAARRVSAAVPSVTVAFWAALSVALMGAASLPFLTLAPVTPRAAGLIAFAGTALVLGYVASVAAMRQGEVAVVAPFRYTSLLWAIALGWFVFGEWPDDWTLAGSALVIAAGLFTLWREARLGVRRRG